MENKIYLVIWGDAKVNDRGDASAFCGCEGAFFDKKEALKVLTAEKDAYIKNILDDADAEDVREKYENGIQVYGSEREEYYEIDITVDDNTSELYIRISEVCIK